MQPIGESVYYLHDNGGRPFRVHIREDSKLVLVYREYEPLSDCLWFVFKALKIFVPEGFDWSCSGDGPLGCPWEGAKGNTILALLSENGGRFEYVFIGGARIFRFQTEEPIEDFQSPVGNNNVPYPWASTASHTYLFDANVRIEGVHGDPYTYYYAWDRFPLRASRPSERWEEPFHEQQRAKEKWRKEVGVAAPYQLLALGRADPLLEDPVSQLNRMYLQHFVAP